MIDSSAKRRLVALFLALALFATACGGGDSGADDNASVTGGSDESSDSGDDGADSGDSTIGEVVGADESADGSDAATAADTDAVPQGGTIRMALQTEAASLNPTNTPFNRAPILLGTAIFDTLVVVDADGQWHNNLTETWTPSPDFVSWDVTLREGITFSDGTPLNSAAVVRNIGAFLSDPLVSLVFRPAFDQENPIESIDELTFRVNANGPNANLPFFFAEQIGMVGSPAWLDARDADPSLDQFPIGAGPYMIEERIQDQRTVLVRNPNYWAEPGNIDRFEFFPVPQGSSRVDQLLGGDVEISHTTDTAGVLSLREAGDSVLRIEDNSGEEFTLLLNAGSAPFDDIRVREAATAAFPKNSYLDFLVQETGLEAETLWSEETPWFAPGVEQPDDRPELAGPLIAAYCADVPESCTDGRVDVEFQHDVSAALDEIAAFVGDPWSEFFNITLDVVPNDQHIQQVTLGLYDVATWRYHGFADPEIDSTFLSCSTIGALSVNFARNCNDERDALFEAQRQTTDFDERYDIWVQIQENLRDSFQYILINHTNWVLASDPSVGGICDATTPDGVALPCQLGGVMRLPQLFLTN